MSRVLGRLHPHYGLLLAGVFMIAQGVFYMLTGKAYTRSRGDIRRANDPKRYWWEIAGAYIMGLMLIGLFLYEN